MNPPAPNFLVVCRRRFLLRPLIWLCAALGLFAARPAWAAAGVPKEYEVKAAFLYNFTKFVEWPKRCFASDDDPLVIGVLGPNPFGRELEAAVRDRRVAGRRLEVRSFESISRVKGVAVLFVPANAEKRIDRDLAAVHADGVLTVGETDRFTALGGVITFRTTHDKVRFEINMSGADLGGLKISAQLQKLALAVRRES